MKKLTYQRREVQRLVDIALQGGAPERAKARARGALRVYCRERQTAFYQLQPLAFTR